MGKNKKDLNEEIEESNIDSEESNIDSEENDSNVVAPDIDNFSISKHQIDGKHSLKYDTIFKGKKEEINEDEELSSTEISYDTIELDKSSSYYSETNDNETYFRTKKLKEKVYQVLDEHTKVDFKVNRRKPSKVDFNSYICILKKNLSEYNFTNVEIFNELSFYFSDNLFNMFKLLDSYWKQEIIKELQEHIGKNNKSKEIRNRNIYESTEIEFQHIDDSGDVKIIQGIVKETDYDNDSFKVDSYENIYTVKLSDVVRIINNTKFKYNLNKLNNIDFL
tara:strand:- start:78941 stop:79774 length:834 start_codon:yes stop_codon:yes gene_type:complete